jgi:hypothetical protein
MYGRLLFFVPYYFYGRWLRVKVFANMSRPDGPKAAVAAGH